MIATHCVQEKGEFMFTELELLNLSHLISKSSILCSINEFMFTEKGDFLS